MDSMAGAADSAACPGQAAGDESAACMAGTADSAACTGQAAGDESAACKTGGPMTGFAQRAPMMRRFAKLDEWLGKRQPSSSSVSWNAASAMVC